MMGISNSIRAFCLIGTLLSGSVSAASFSFTGNLITDDDVQLFNFTVGSTSTVTLLTLSYAGGTNFQGDTIAEGGFDPIMALFTGAGTFIQGNDDGDCYITPPEVATSGVTGECLDTYLQTTLAPGDYTVAVSQYDNYNVGDLSDGFINEGLPNFTAPAGCSNGQFCDIAATNRTGFWAFDILNVDSASVVSEVPAPAAVWLFGSGILGLIGVARRNKA
jgi:hypothetical protein